MYDYNYAFKKAAYRKHVNLTEHEDSIKTALQETFQEAVKEIIVQPHEFTFFLTREARVGELRIMGVLISRNDTFLRSLRLEYGDSTKIFERSMKNTKNYAMY